MTTFARPLTVIYATVALDAVGIGIIFPILPRLLESVTHTGQVAHYVGITAALYAAMQFAFAPILGALSDRIGRRPVLLVSMAGAAVDYVVMALAPSLWLFLIGRAIAGVTGANMSVATAYVTDIAPEPDRARRFGMMSAMFGAGFIIGPVLGGVLGDQWLRAPAVAAAILNAGNFALALFVLPESRIPSHAPLDIGALNPLAPLRELSALQGVLPVVLVYFLLSAAGESYGVCWALWGRDAFGWNDLWIGLSLGAFGLCQTLVQAVLPGPVTRILGPRRATVTGIACSCAALVALAFAGQGWIVFAVMPLFALGSVGTPAFQALATALVDDARQGQLQGVLASAISLSSIAAPFGFSALYLATERSWPGAVWLWVVAVYAAAIPLIVLSTRAKPSPLPLPTTAKEQMS